MFQYNTVVVLFASSILGSIGAVLGCFLLLKKQALISDTISHATLPGVGIAFVVMELIGYGKSLPGLLLGGGITSGLAILFLFLIRRTSKIQEDANLAIILSVFFGLGIVVLSLAQRMPRGSAAGLNSFIYGKTASILASDALFIAGIAVIVLIVITLLYKEFNLLCFDREWAIAQGFPVQALDATLAVLSLLLIIAGLQAVGLILMIAILLIPPVAARFWTKRIGQMTLLAASFGLFSSFAGTMISSNMADAPTGAIIVVVMGALFLLGMLFGTQSGILFLALQNRAIKNTIISERLFLNCYYAVLPLTTTQILDYVAAIEESQEDSSLQANIFRHQRFFEIEHYQIFRTSGWSAWQIARCLKRNLKEGNLQKIDTDMYTFSKKGLVMMLRIARLHERKHQMLRYRPIHTTTLNISSSESINEDPELHREINRLLKQSQPVLFDRKIDKLMRDNT